MKFEKLLRMYWIALILFPALGLSQSPCYYDHTQQIADTVMFGSRNVNAPEELTEFAFLMGKWKCKVKIQEPDGTRSRYKAVWTGRYILDGYAIADQFRMTDEHNKLIMLGSNYRTYNNKSKTWEMKWYEALSSTWLNLVPQDLGGVRLTDSSISYKTWFKSGVIHRMTFSEICKEKFIWSIDSSADGGQTWKDSVMVIEAFRYSN